MAQILFNFLGPIRSIAIYIDSIVFGLIDNCFEIIMGFANSEFYKLDIIDDIRKKIYFVITLIAMFRLAFLLINSLINPDKLNDQNEGLSKVAFNFVIMLVLLVVTPMLFNEALDIQETVVTNNMITGIFSDAPVGSTSTSTDYKEVAKDSSRKMKDLVIGSLIYPDPAIAEFEDSNKKWVVKDDVCKGKCAKAVEAYNKMLAPDGDGMKYTILSKYVGVTEKVDDEEIFVYNYQMFLTLICAGFIVYILLSFSFDLAKRFIELNLLMVLSPLFIATYIDPKSAKSGPFNNWLKAVGKSYVGLFLRLGALAVMLLFIKIISSEELDTSSLGFIGKIILLFAVLTFCKNIPKWLGDLLGAGDAMGGLGLGKKITDTPLLGGAAKKAGLMATGAVAGAATSAAALGRQRRQLRAQARKDAGLGRVLNGHNKKDYGSYADLRKARRDAYDKAFEGAGLKRGAAGAIGQGLAGIALGAKAGGSTGIKADNIRGAFKGSVQSSKQGLAGLGVTGGESLGQKIMTGIGIGTAALESQFGTFEQRDKRAKELENNRTVQSFAAGSDVTGAGYGKGKIAMSRKDKNSIAETTAFGENDGVKSFEDYCASQYATTMFGENTTIARNVDAKGKTISYNITDTLTGKTVNVGTDQLTTNMNGLVQGVGMQYMAQNWYGVQSQGISNYQHADAAAKSASQLLKTIESQVSDLTNAVKSSVSSMGAVSDAVKTRMSNLDIKFDPSGKIQLDDANISKLGKYVASVKGDPKLDTSEKEALLTPLSGFIDEASRLTATVSQKERAQAELVAAEAEAKKYEGIYITADGVTAEEKIATADKKASEAKGHIDASKTKDDKK